MASWETQGPCRSHESEPFMHNQLNITGSVAKQRRGGTRTIATTRNVKRTKIVESSTPTFDNRIFRLGYGTKSSRSFSNIRHPTHITYEESKSTPKIRFEHREPLCAKATATSTLGAATCNGSKLCKGAGTSHTAKMLALVTLQLSAR